MTVDQITLWNIEQPDNRIRQARELTQRCNNLSMFEVAGFIQAYLHGEINFGFRCAFGEETNCGFIVSAAQPSSRQRSESLTQRPAHDAETGEPDFGRQEPLMLPYNVELMEGVEKIIPSLVRFQRFDDGLFLYGSAFTNLAPL